MKKSLESLEFSTRLFGKVSSIDETFIFEKMSFPSVFPWCLKDFADFALKTANALCYVANGVKWYNMQRMGRLMLGFLFLIRKKVHFLKTR